MAIPKGSNRISPYTRVVAVSDLSSLVLRKKEGKEGKGKKGKRAK